MSGNKIPKILHFCWFGKGEKSELMNRCISSWRRELSDYEIIEWNEKNFNMHMNKYVEEAYYHGKYAFVSDFVRLYALYEYGGVYLDTDVEVIKNFDELLCNDGFCGFEDKELVSTAIIGAKKGNALISKWLDTYEGRKFIEKGKENTETNVRVFTNLLLNEGMKQNNKKQSIEDKFTIYPIEYFSPLKLMHKKPNLTSNTMSIHWFEGTWLDWNKKIKILIIVLFKDIFGFRLYNFLIKKIKNK